MSNAIPMSAAAWYQVEQTSECATLYLTERLRVHDVPALIALCDSLSPTVRTLRLDLRAIGSLNADGVDVVRRLLRHWEASRGGEFRLSTSHLMATYRPALPACPAAASDSWPVMNEALAATYL